MRIEEFTFFPCYSVFMPEYIAAFVQLCTKRRRTSDSSSEAEEDEASCPVCLQTIYGTPDLIATHVDRCVRRVSLFRSSFERFTLD